MKNVIDFKKEIFNFMEGSLSDFSLSVRYIKSRRFFYVVLKNIKDSRSINFFAHSYSEIYYNLVCFEFGYDYKRI